MNPMTFIGVCENSKYTFLSFFRRSHFCYLKKMDKFNYRRPRVSCTVLETSGSAGRDG